MTSPNQHIIEFLDYYCVFTCPPEYAVLLKGKWGCGKTWFIKKYCDHIEGNGHKYLYASLYGVTSYKEIENIFFQQLHPILASKGMALTGKILKGLIKTTLKIDFDGDNKPDATVSSQIPEINLPEEFTSADDNILIFDDLERCGIKKQDVLGYINHFVEHQGFKVIIIANEEDIIEKDTSETLYRNIKEKLIGKTFEIISDIDGAIENFISLLENDDVRKIITDHTETIKESYNASKYENLRHLKQSLWDFERFYLSLPNEIKSNDEFNSDLIKLFLAFSFEIKSGSILPDNLGKFTSSYMDGVIGDKQKEKSKYKILSEKYSNIEFYNHIIDLPSWKLFFDKGIIDKDKILESLSKSKYLQDQNTPNWVKLWHFLDRSDTDFLDLYNQVTQEFSNREFDKIGIIKHITGMFLWFSELGLIEETKKKIVEDSKEYIDYLKEQKLLNQNTDQHLSIFEDDSWGGLGYSGKDLSEFKEITEYIKTKSEESSIENMPEAAENLLATMRDDTRKFYTQIVHTNSEDNLYYETPILKYINPENFVADFENLSPEDKRFVSYALTKRYKSHIFLEKIYEEAEWLESVKAILSEKQQILRGKVSGYIIKSVINNHIDKSLETLKNYNTQRLTI